MRKLFIATKRYLRGANERRISIYASSGAFYIFLSVIPFFILAASVLPLSQWKSEELNAAIRMLAPEKVAVLLESVVNQVYAYSGGVRSVSLLISLWSASKVISALMRGIITASGSTKSTAYFRLTLKAMGYSVLMILAIYILMLASAVLSVLQRFRIYIAVWNRFIFPVVLFLLLAAAYRIIPGKSKNYRYAFPGAFLAAAAWLGFNTIYSLWLSYSDRYGVYGTIGSVIVTLLWLYVSLYIILSGAYFNSFVACSSTMVKLRMIKNRKSNAPSDKMESGEESAKPD